MAAVVEGPQAQTVLVGDISELDSKLASHGHRKRRQAAVWNCLRPHFWHRIGVNSKVNSSYQASC